MTPRQIAVVADALREAGLDEEAIERALAAIDSPPFVFVPRGSDIRASDLAAPSFAGAQIVEYSGAPTVEPPRGYAALLVELERLCSLIKEAEWADHAQGEWWCPWCEAEKFRGEHNEGCPAFTRTGNLR